jgi:hypothetical protein
VQACKSPQKDLSSLPSFLGSRPVAAARGAPRKEAVVSALTSPFYKLTHRRLSASPITLRSSHNIWLVRES